MKRIKFYWFFVIANLLFATSINAQGVSISDNPGDSPHVSAMLDVKADDKGVLIPRVSIDDLNTPAPVTNPAIGLLVYNTNETTGIGFYYWNGTYWVTLEGPEGPQGDTGPEGPSGSDGESAYEVWLNEGNVGSEQDFLDSLIGEAGPEGQEGPVGPSGSDGKSAYEVWLNEGNVGSEQDFLDSLIGETGPEGQEGPVGPSGSDGESAYEVWLNEGNVGLEQDFLDSLIGEAGPEGQEGPVGPPGPVGCETENLVIKSDGSSAVCSQIYDNGIFVGIGTSNPTRSLALCGDGARTIGMENNTDLLAGYGLTLRAGGAGTGSTNRRGGNLYLDSGISTGNETSNIYFSTPTPGASGSDARNPTVKMTIGGNGNVGIGITDAQNKLHINGHDNDGGIRLERTGSYPYYWQIVTPTTNNLWFRYDGTLKAYINHEDGSWNQASDISLKQNFTPLNSCLNKIMLLNPLEYSFIDAKNGKRNIGFISQEVEEVFPLLVNEQDGKKFLNYTLFSVVIIKAMQEQQEMIEQQNEEIERLKEKMNLLISEFDKN